MKNNQVAIMIEDFDHKLDVILEMLSTKASSEDVHKIDQRLQRVETKLTLHAQRMTDYDWLFANHETRLNNLETI